MKLRGLLVGGAIALAATAMTSAATTAHAATASHQTTSGITRIDLSHGFASALRAETNRAYGKAGIMRPVGYRLGKSTAAAACKEPNCNMAYHGGLIQTKPVVYLLFWGPKWQQSTYTPEAKYLINLFTGLGKSSDHWSTTTSQYKGKNGHPTFGTSVFKAAYIDKSAPPTVNQSVLGAEAVAFANQVHVRGSNLQIVIVSQSGTCFSDGFAGSCGHVNTNGQYCAYHSANSGLAYTNLPYQLDAGRLCGEFFHNTTKLAGFSIVGGHEYAETITDPFPASGWVDNNDNVSGGEIGDKCAWAGQIWGSHDPFGYVSLSTGKFPMQSLWNNKATNCIM